MTDPQVPSADPLERWRLLGPDAAAPRPGRRWWHRRGTYLSDVCLTVHLTPSGLRRDDLTEAKDALYAYLRRVGHTALEHDFMRPLACVLDLDGVVAETAALASELAGWGADQDWHRGAFGLYVECGRSPPCAPGLDKGAAAGTGVGSPAAARLLDLLAPKVDALVPTEAEERDAPWFAEALRRRLNTRPPETSEAALAAARLVDLLAGRLSQDRDLESKDRGEEATRAWLGRAWVDSVVQEAQRLAVGEQHRRPTRPHVRLSTRGGRRRSHRGVWRGGGD